MSDEVQVKRNYHRQRLQEKVTKKEYSLVELESVLETSYRTLLGYVETGRLKGTKVDNRRWVIKAEDIKDFIWNGLPDTGLDRKYIPETHDEIVRKLASQNRTIEYISDLLGITETTFYRWKNTHESLREAYEQGVSNKVDNVEHSLFEKAKGLIVEDVNETYEEDEN